MSCYQPTGDDVRISHRVALWIYHSGRYIGSRDLIQGIGISDHQAKAAMRRLQEQADNWFGRGNYRWRQQPGCGAQRRIQLRILVEPRLPDEITITQLVAMELEQHPEIGTQALRTKYHCSKTLIYHARVLLETGSTPRRSTAARHSEYGEAIRVYKRFIKVWPRK